MICIAIFAFYDWNLYYIYITYIYILPTVNFKAIYYQKERTLRYKTSILFIVIVFMILILPTPFIVNAYADCTDIIVGKKATLDGSVINSHTGACSDSRVHVVPARTYKKGTMAPVYWGMVFFGRDDERAGLPVGNYGQVIGEIPQVEKTYSYFHTGYSQFNEHQLAFGESTLSQKEELKT